MRIRFFGEPWGNDNMRAPICDDDQYRIPVPVGTKCMSCSKAIEEHHRGVVTACSPGIFGHWVLDIEVTEDDVLGEKWWEGQSPGVAKMPVCSYHLLCFIKSTIGSDGLSQEILARMNYRVDDDEPVKPQPRENLDDLDVGGWRSKGE